MKKLMLIGQEINLKNFKKKQKIIFFSKKEEKTVEIIKKYGREGKIFISQMLRAIDINSGNEGEEVI